MPNPIAQCLENLTRRSPRTADICAFLAPLAATDPTEHLTPGPGRDVRVEGNGLGGCALLNAGRAVHPFAYACLGPANEADA